MATGTERQGEAVAWRCLVHITTVPMTLRFLAGQLRWQQGQGRDVHVVSSPGADLDAIARSEGIQAHAVPLERRITPMRDLRALAGLVRLLRKLKPQVVHAHTPKGGLLGTMAGWFARVPVRIYHVHGLPFVTAQGFRRGLLLATEWAAARFATQVLCVSRSVREVAVAEGLCPASKIAVLGGGSINGVDAERFCPPADEDRRRDARLSRGLPADALVIGYVGRIVRDKGWVELAQAWRSLRDRYPRAWLMVAGPFEPQDPVPEDVADLIRTDPRIRYLGLEWDTPPLYAAMDLVVLPTYREGFPVVPLEAAAMALPVVATRVSGCIDAVVDGVTGTLVPPRDPVALEQAMAAYLESRDLRRLHGTAARRRVLESFSREVIWRETAALYERLLGAVGRQRGWRLVLKSVLDRAAAAAGLIVASPLLAVTAVLVRLTLGTPVLFRQDRPGLHGRPFRLAKFRTMRDAVGADGAPLPDAERLTRLGGFLRSTSLDELPQLWNVLRGELSLVGPRPLLVRYLPRYSAEQARRHDVRPGITGWAQVNGRNAISWEEKFLLDVWYVDHWSLALDLKILALTLLRVVKPSGISRQGHATMPEFMGSEERK